MTSLTVNLGERSYPIYIKAGLLSQPGLFDPYLKAPKVAIVTNDKVAPLYLHKVQQALGSVDYQVITLADGEQHKNLATVEQIFSQLLQQHAGRDTSIIALGGGVIGDMAGFAAACFQRGIGFIQVPTTLLSQVDSSVGGKTGVNHPLGKNMIGAFYQPQAVMIDTDSLSTLPPREFAAGMAEVIKYGIIYDHSFFTWLEQNVDALIQLQQDALHYAIQRCCQIKADIVAQDEHESGIRALLNLGHTFGHAIEAEQGYGNWLHGEAVAAGIILAAQAAEHKGWLTESEVCRIRALLTAFSLPVTGPKDMHFADYMRHMRHDKKVAAGKIRFIIPCNIGKAVVTDQLTEDELKAILT